MAERSILIAGAGIAGLTAALCFAAEGFSVTVCERAARLEETGAGLQISPNATRILDRLGVLAQLRRAAVQPMSICLRSAATLRPLAVVPLGEEGEKRWGAPYLVAHRADLQRALLNRMRDVPEIRLVTGAEVTSASFATGKVTVTVEKDAVTDEKHCDLLIGADGVWSTLRSVIGRDESRFTGYVAHRATLKADKVAGDEGAALLDPTVVTAFLAPQFHLVAYPLRGGAEINLVAIAKGDAMAERWANEADTSRLSAVTAKASPALALLFDKTSWTAWPIHSTTGGGRWIHPGGLALIGDASHALTPYAAQGAAMAIEDAALLAKLVARSRDMAAALEAFERLRQPRLDRVARRGRFNHFVWHASGLAAFGRNLVLRLRNPESLAADLDWLYGYDVEDELTLEPVAGKSEA